MAEGKPAVKNSKPLSTDEYQWTSIESMTQDQMIEELLEQRKAFETV